VRNVRTDLNAFTSAEIQLLVYHGYMRAHEVFSLGLEIANLDAELANQFDLHHDQESCNYQRSDRQHQRKAGAQGSSASFEDQRRGRGQRREARSTIRRAFLTEGIKFKGQGADGTFSTVRLHEDVAGIVQTKTCMPSADSSIGDDKWCPSRRSMKLTDTTLPKADSSRLLSAHVKAGVSECCYWRFRAD